jgi:GT2 family glycosyltransferase
MSSTITRPAADAPTTHRSRERVYVVLLNLNRWQDTIECMESLLRSEYPNVRTVVVDNGSMDDSVEQFIAWASGERPYTPPSTPLARLTTPPVEKPLAYAVMTSEQSERGMAGDDLPAFTLITNRRNTGFAAGNNVALRFILSGESTGGGYALLINNDMVVDPAAIGALVDSIETDPTIAAMGGVIYDYSDPSLVQMVGGARTTGLGMVKVFGAGLRRDQVPAPIELGFVGGGCLLMRLATLRDVGLLDESFFVYGEDYDWGERMRKCGYRLTYTPHAALWHKGGATVVSRSPFQDYHMVRGTLGFVRKHAPRWILAAFGYSLFRALAPKILRREWTRVRAVLRAYADHARAGKAPSQGFGTTADSAP